MPTRDSAAANQLIGPVLRSVSRSFYLSIRFLPSGLREPVALTYLLARATDTLADTNEIGADVRKEKLKVLTSAIQQDEPPLQVVEELQRSFASLQKNEAERELIERLSICLDLLGRTPSPDRRDIREVLGKINRAQSLDLERFGEAKFVRALTSVADLNEYTYLIAGCVGEFWTNLCARHVGSFADVPVDKMLELGRHYGTGLQLINICRDAGTDLRAGRCYFPEEDLQAAGIEASQILTQRAKFLPVLQKWLAKAEQGLRAGMQYCLRVHNRRVRGATVLPAMIGARTLALLQQSGADCLEEKIKVPRQEVRRMLRSIAISLASKQFLERMFETALQR